MRGVLRLATYRRLLAAYALNELAWSFSTLALSFLIYRRSGSALGAAAFFLGTLFVPALISPAVVARIDRRHPRLTLSVLYGLEAVAYVALALVANRAPWAIVLVIATLDGIIALTARSLARAVSASVTSAAGLLREGNALANTLFTVCFMAGPAIAGGVIVAGGVSTVLFINGGLFTLITVVLMTASNLPGPAPSELEAEGGGRLKAAVAYAMSRPTIRTLLGTQSALTLFFSLSVPVEVAFAQHTLHAGAAGYGVLFSAWGGGAVAGSTIYARWRRLPARELIVLGSVLLGGGLVLMAIAPTLAVALVGSVIAGVGNGIFAVAARTAVQEAVEPEWMAMMMSFNESLGQLVPGAGILLGGVLATVASPRVALGVGGVGALALTAVTWALLRPPVRTSRPHIEGPAHDQV